MYFQQLSGIQVGALRNLILSDLAQEVSLHSKEALQEEVNIQPLLFPFFLLCLKIVFFLCTGRKKIHILQNNQDKTL